MESQQQQLQSDTSNIPTSATVSPQISEKWWWQFGTRTPAWLAQLPDNLIGLFEQYKQPVITLALMMAAIIALKVVLAVMDALNDVPLLTPTLELVGIGYSAWFINRYLLRAPNRQELWQEIQRFLDR